MRSAMSLKKKKRIYKERKEDFVKNFHIFRLILYTFLLREKKDHFL